MTPDESVAASTTTPMTTTPGIELLETTQPEDVFILNGLEPSEEWRRDYRTVAPLPGGAPAMTRKLEKFTYALSDTTTPVPLDIEDLVSSTSPHNKNKYNYMTDRKI